MKDRKVLKESQENRVRTVLWVRGVRLGFRANKDFRVLKENKVWKDRWVPKVRKAPLGCRASKASRVRRVRRVPRVPKGRRARRHCSGRIQTREQQATAGRAPWDKLSSQLGLS